MERAKFVAQAKAARYEFREEYITPNGRMVSNSQAAYALAICLNILTPSQRVHAGHRLAELVVKNSFRLATGFAGTPFLREALAITGHTQAAFSALLEKSCPSWLYPVTLGATTMWERWDSMLPDGNVNPGEMTSFDHYASGAIGKFLYERVAGLQRTEPGWTKCRIAPDIGADFTNASASHVTPFGTVSCAWETNASEQGEENFRINGVIPHGMEAEIVIPEHAGTRVEHVGPGERSFETTCNRDYEWPVPRVARHRYNFTDLECHYKRWL
jgi:alpha-L-rhamnosidase